MYFLCKIILKPAAKTNEIFDHLTLIQHKHLAIMSAFPGSITFDEYGRPFIILRDQDSQKRLTGNDAIKVSFRPFPGTYLGEYHKNCKIFTISHAVLSKIWDFSVISKVFLSVL